MARHDLILPELGIDDQAIMASLWLVERGSRVRDGDPVPEVLVGQRLAVIKSDLP